MIARSLLIVVLALANMHAVLGGGLTSRFEQFMSFGTRELLATTFRKAKMEKKIAYEGTPLDVIRGIKSSHSCWVKCKRNPSCSRFTYIPGQWKKCELYRKGDRSVKKVKSAYAISGYADWRVKVNNWGKVKPDANKGNKGNKGNKNTNNGGNIGSEVAYEAPGYTGSGGFDVCDIVDCSGLDGGSGGGNADPILPPSPDQGGWEPISDYKLMSGKTIFGRRINSILPCIGNIARRYSDCQSQCNRDGKCTAWTWASFDCSWVGDSRDSGVCYLMTDTDSNDVFTAPTNGDFISGMKNGGSGGGGWDGGWDGGSDGAYEDPGAGSFDSAIYDSFGNCIGNCGPTSGSSGAYEAPGYY